MRHELDWKEKSKCIFSVSMQSEVSWKRRFCRRNRLPLSAATTLPPGVSGWKAEFRRLSHSAPSVLCQELDDHALEVTHAAISADGSLLATCGSDAQV